MQKLKYLVPIGALFSVVGLVGIFYEWRKVHAQFIELLELKEDYQEYIELLRKKLPADVIQDDSCILPFEQWVVLNRDISYLKDSAISFAVLTDECDLNIFDDLYQSYEENPFVRTTKPVSKKNVRRSPVPRSSPVRLEQDGIQRAMLWPLDKGTFRISSPFGPRKREDGSPGFHTGIDLAAAKGTPVKAAAAGVVVEAGFAPGFGNTVVIAHNRKYKTRYAHLSKIHVSKGEKVERGHRIGAVGNTGHVLGQNGVHLHFEVYVFGKRVNPRQFLPL